MTEPGRGRILLTRRQGLMAAATVAGAAVLAACSSDATPSGSSAAAASASADPAITDEIALLALYDRTIAALPDLARYLAPIRDQHAQHVTALGGSPDLGSAGATAGTASAAPGIAADPTAAITTLIDAERSAAKQRIDASVDATAPERVRTLVFIAASEASHVPTLKDLNP